MGSANQAGIDAAEGVLDRLLFRPHYTDYVAELVSATEGEVAEAIMAAYEERFS